MDSIKNQKRAKTIQEAGITLELADLGVVEVKRQSPNTNYVTPMNPDMPCTRIAFTDGKVSLNRKNGDLTETITDASWAAVTSGKHVILITEKDNTSAAAAIRGWIRKSGLKIKRLGFPAFMSFV